MGIPEQPEVLLRRSLDNNNIGKMLAMFRQHSITHLFSNIINLRNFQNFIHYAHNVNDLTRTLDHSPIDKSI